MNHVRPWGLAVAGVPDPRVAVLLAVEIDEATFARYEWGRGRQGLSRGVALDAQLVARAWDREPATSVETAAARLALMLDEGERVGRDVGEPGSVVA